MSWRTEILTVLLVTVLRVGDASAAPRNVTFRADDGRIVTGTMFDAGHVPAPAVVLVPALGHPRDEWLAIAQRFADLNIAALAIDLPGATVPAEPKDLAGWNIVVRASVTWLTAQPTVRPTAIAAVGSSLGGSLVALAGAADPRIKALALISPSEDFRGVRIESALRQTGSRPVLFIASRHDPYANRSARELSRDAAGPRETFLGDAASHGVPLLTAEPDLARRLVEWFLQTLGVN
jgi:dienelactone hydrolase